MITIVMTIYSPRESALARIRAAKLAMQSWQTHLLYEAPIALHVADDGSSLSFDPLAWTKGPVARSWQDRHGVGASLNQGFRNAFTISPVVLYMVDDWALTQPFYLTPWIQLLLEREDVGMVRLGPPHPGTGGKVEAFTAHWQGWGLRLDKQGFAFAHRPALYHKRLIDAYGWFEEDVNALECERIYAEKVARLPGPDIVLALPHPWQHLESVELAHVDPRNDPQ